MQNPFSLNEQSGGDFIVLTCFNFRDEKERWIRGKYVDKEFLPPPPYIDIPLNQVSRLYTQTVRSLFVAEQFMSQHRCGSRVSGKAVHMYKGLGVCFADFISFFINIP